MREARWCLVLGISSLPKEQATIARGSTAPGTIGTAHLSRENDPIMTRGSVLTSAATSVAVLLQQGNAAATCSWYQRLCSLFMQIGDRNLRRVMMRIGFLSLPVPGHLNPMTTLARRLQA